jgi:hypothetical protein
MGVVPNFHCDWNWGQNAISSPSGFFHVIVYLLRIQYSVDLRGRKVDRGPYYLNIWTHTQVELSGLWGVTLSILDLPKVQWNTLADQLESIQTHYANSLAQCLHRYSVLSEQLPVSQWIHSWLVTLEGKRHMWLCKTGVGALSLSSILIYEKIINASEFTERAGLYESISHSHITTALDIYVSKAKWYKRNVCSMKVLWTFIYTNIFAVCIKVTKKSKAITVTGLEGL